MDQHFLLWAIGPDHPGIVAAVTKSLYKHDCNLEDSSMMRLGAEFGMFLLFSSKTFLNANLKKELSSIKRSMKLSLGIKKISSHLARFTPLKKNSFRVTLYGADKPGIVYALTETLARHKFNISDLQTHRISASKKPGYILFIEGDVDTNNRFNQLKKSLALLQKKLQVTLRIEPFEQPVL